MTIDMYYDGQHSTSPACAVRDTRQSASTRLHRPHGHGDGQSLKRITGTACLELPPQAVSQRPTRPARVAAIIYSLTCSSQRGSIVAGQGRAGQGRNSVGWHLFQFFAGHLNASRQYLVLSGCDDCLTALRTSTMLQLLSNTYLTCLLCYLVCILPWSTPPDTQPSTHAVDSRRYC